MHTGDTVDDAVLIEAVRAALLRLYDPAALASAPLISELAKRGISVPSNSLNDLLVSTIERLKPATPAPERSHGWRCYRYLKLRYVDCQPHTSISGDLGISRRHTARVHQDALRALAELLLVRLGSPAAPPATPARATPRTRPTNDREALPRTDAPWEAELLAIGRNQPEAAVNISDVTAGVSETFRRFASTHHDELRITLPERLPPVWVNRVALRQVLLNLLLYLIRIFRAPDEAAGIVISLQGNQDNAEVILAIGCEGPDIAAAGHSALDNEGKRLLIAAKRIAELQGGMVEEVNAAGSLVGLRLHLPISAAHRILLIDDNPDVGELFQRMLGQRDYHVTQARTANRALKSVHENPPDTVILDVVMPTRDGWEILTALREDPKTAEIPVVVCSVLPDRDLALSLGAADFVGKPVTRASLVQALARVRKWVP